MLRFWVLVLAMLCICSPLAAQQKRIALTFDDVPRGKGAFFHPDERTRRLIAALQAAKVKQAAFFLNPANFGVGDGLGDGAARVDAYVRAGHVIANHSNTHLSLNANSADAFIADIDAAERWLAGRAGYRPWFRFPYLHEGGADKNKRDIIRAALQARGLRNGYVTADGSDWHLEALTIKAAENSREINMKALRRLYVATQMSGIEYHDAMARSVLGRSPAHVMLLHETDLAALFVGDLVAELRRGGWKIITADEAYADPLRRAMPDVPFASGTLTGSMAWERDIDPPMWPIFFSTDLMTTMFENQVLSAARAR